MFRVFYFRTLVPVRKHFNSENLSNYGMYICLLVCGKVVGKPTFLLSVLIHVYNFLLVFSFLLASRSSVL